MVKCEKFKPLGGFACLAALALAFGLAFAACGGDDGGDNNSGGTVPAEAQQLIDAINAIEPDAAYWDDYVSKLRQETIVSLRKDITLSTSLTVPEGVTMDQGNFVSRKINFENNAELTVNGVINMGYWYSFSFSGKVAIDGSGTIEAYQQRDFSIGAGTELTLTDVKLSGIAIGVSGEGAKLTMNGAAAISDNTSGVSVDYRYYGVVVVGDGGTFTMNDDAKVSDNDLSNNFDWITSGLRTPKCQTMTYPTTLQEVL